MTVLGNVAGSWAHGQSVDDVCERFEAAWRCGAATSIEAVLRQANPALDATALLQELVLVEIDLRREHGGRPHADDYASRFPDCRSWIAELFCDEASAAAGNRSDVTAAASSQPAGGVNVPGYEILGEIGRGAMAVVYRAYDLRLNRMVALKLIHRHLQHSRFNHRQMQREAKSIARLRHAGIMQIYGIGEHEGQPYLILELINGRSLQEWLGDQLHPPHWSAGLIAQVARAVAHAHQQGVIHRDLKPANILLTPSLGARWAFDSSAQEPSGPNQEVTFEQGVPFPVIADFGLAKQLFASDTISGPGALFGTPDYMPPEQAEGRSFEATPESDIYSLGAILYELLTGHPPLVGDTPVETMRLIRHAAPVPLRRIAPQVPAWLEAICLRCLEKAPDRRFDSAALLADELERGCQSAGLSRHRGSDPGDGRRGLPSILGAGFSAVGAWLSSRPEPMQNTRRAA